MKTLLRLVTLAALFVAASAAVAEPIDPDPDGMSIYFDTDATVYCLELDDWEPAAGAGPTVTAYLIITRPFLPSPWFHTIQAWEAHLEIVTNSYTLPPTVWWLAGNGMADYGPGVDDYVIGLGYGVPITGDATVIAWIDLPWSGWEGHAEATFILLGVEYSLSFPDGPGYAAEAGFPSPCQPLFGAWGEVAWINGGCQTIADEELTWGAVKGLY